MQLREFEVKCSTATDKASRLASRLQQEEAQRTHAQKEVQKKNERIQLLQEQMQTVTSQLAATEEQLNALRRSAQGEVQRLQSVVDEVRIQQ